MHDDIARRSCYSSTCYYSPTGVISQIRALPREYLTLYRTPVHTDRGCAHTKDPYCAMRGSDISYVLCVCNRVTVKAVRHTAQPQQPFAFHKPTNFINYSLLSSGTHSYLATQWLTYKGTYAAAIPQVVSSSNLPPQAFNTK